MSSDRHSQADPVELINDPIEKANREAENAVRQFLEAMDIVRDHIPPSERNFRLTQAIILTLHETALTGIHPLAGTYRNSQVWIGKSSHVPPPHREVPDLVSQMCAFVNDNWSDWNAVRLAAYVLWRMNWIHPFADGNGRTARMVSYVIMCAKLRSVLPGTPTIPDQIASDKGPYYSALEKADDSWKRNILALSEMEQMVGSMLARQLLAVAEEAAL